MTQMTESPLTSVDLPTEAVRIAVEHAAAQGRSLSAWLTTAISDQAAAQRPITAADVDDGGFCTPAPRRAS